MPGAGAGGVGAVHQGVDAAAVEFGDQALNGEDQARGAGDVADEHQPRAARAAGKSLTPSEQDELLALVDAEVRESGERAATALQSSHIAQPRFAIRREPIRQRCSGFPKPSR